MTFTEMSCIRLLAYANRFSEKRTYTVEILRDKTFKII